MKKYIIKVNGVSYDVEVEEASSAAAAAIPAAAMPAAAAIPAAAATALPAAAAAQAAPAVAPAPAPTPAAAHVAGATVVSAPMPGTVINVLVSVGDDVKKSQTVALLEAMKMENEIFSPVNGKILAVHTSKGASVSTGDLLLSIG